MDIVSLKPEARLQRCLVELYEAMVRLDVETVERAIDATSDLLSTGERLEDLVADAILDGIRFGFRAAVHVEMAGGMMIRIIERGGIRLTNEFASGLESPRRVALVRAIEAAIAETGNRTAEKGRIG